MKLKYGQARPYQMQWALMRRKVRIDGRLEPVVNGYLIEPVPKDTNTPEGFYHNEPQYDTLENRYRARQGLHKL